MADVHAAVVDGAVQQCQVVCALGGVAERPVDFAAQSVVHVLVQPVGDDVAVGGGPDVEETLVR